MDIPTTLGWGCVGQLQTRKWNAIPGLAGTELIKGIKFSKLSLT